MGGGGKDKRVGYSDFIRSSLVTFGKGIAGVVGDIIEVKTLVRDHIGVALVKRAFFCAVAVEIAPAAILNEF